MQPSTQPEGLAQRPVFLTAEWRHLVMLNFEIDPDLLRNRIPQGTELDSWHGRTYVSMVGFQFLNTKLLGFPIPFHRHFDEVNLRFYVRRRVNNKWRRGVVFIKEIVPIPSVALIARWVYNENYITLPMRNRIEVPGSAEKNSGSFTYSWKWRKVWAHVGADVLGDPLLVENDSEVQFITEHYWGYASQRNGGTAEYQVEHPPWKVWSATSIRFDCDVASLYGLEFADVLSRSPTSSFVAEGSEIIVRGGTRI